MSDLCIKCKLPVTSRQQAVECEDCQQWQHRTCGTGISLGQYREAIWSDESLEWKCSECSNPENVTTQIHWTQALWRKVQALGLSTAYKEDDGTYKFIRKLMALPFLPRSEIPRIFIRLLPEARTDALQSLTKYIKEQWIDSTVFPPENWSIYGQVIRTNNDLEGYHNALNRRACGKVHLPFYMLVQFLHREASLVGIQVKLVSEKKLKRIQRKKYRNLQSKVLKLWEEYSKNEKSAIQLLKSCSVLNGPIRGH